MTAAALDRSAVARRAGEVALAIGPPVAVALVVVINAWAGLMRSVGFWDTGEFQTVLPIMGTAHPTGYPTYVVVGFLANILLSPLGAPAFRMSVLSLASIAVAAGMTVILVRRLTSSMPIAAATGLGMAVTPVVWADATRADPHSLHLAFVATLLYLLVRWEQEHRSGRDTRPAEGSAGERAVTPTAGKDAVGPMAGGRRTDRWLLLAAAVFGLGAGNHSLILLLVPPIGLYVLAVEPRIVLRPRLVAAVIGVAVGVTTLVYLELPLRAGLLRAPLVYGHPDTWDGFWYIALAEQFRGALIDPFGDLPRKVGDLVSLSWSQLGPLTLLVPPAFAVTIWKAPRYALLSGFAMVITVLFDASYVNADIERYYLGPVLWAWTWIGLLGATAVRGVTGLLMRLVGSADSSPRRVVAGGLALGVGAALLVPSVASWPVRRLEADRSMDTGAAAWLDQVLPVVAPNAVVVSWWSTSTPLWYAQIVEGRRPDIFVVDDRMVLDLNLGTVGDVLDHELGVRPLYVIRQSAQDLDAIGARFELRSTNAGSGGTEVFEVIGRRSP